MIFKKPKFWDLKKLNLISFFLLPLTLIIIINNYFLKFKPKKNQDIKMLTELHSIELKEEGTNPEEFLKKIRLFGFSIFDIDETKEKLIDVTNEELLENYPKKEVFTNIFCKKTNKE